MRLNVRKIKKLVKLGRKNSQKYLKIGKETTRKIYGKASQIIKSRPILSFLSLLALLFATIIISNIIARPKPEVQKPPAVKKVSIYRIGTAPKIVLQAQVEKSGVIDITALAGGIIQNIFVADGDKVGRGKWLISLSTNYQGGNALAVARQLSEKQNQLIEESYPLQKDLVSKQRDQANANLSNFEDLRDITSKSIDDTQNLINLNNTIISSLNDSLNALTANPPSASNSALILSTRQLESQFQSANLQLNSALRNSQYQVDTNNPPTQLVQLQKDIALKQLDLQDKALDLNKEISNLQLQLARINEAMMYPAAPMEATIEKIYIRRGQMVGPGTKLMTISAVGKRNIKAVAYVAKDIVDKISKLEPSVLSIGNKTISMYPTYVSSEAITGNLYAVSFTLSADTYSAVADKDYITVQLPIGYADTTAAVPYIPIDSVYQTQEEAYAYVIENGKAKSKTVVLGNVYGRYVQVDSGLTSGDRVILDRNVVSGDLVE